MAFWLQFLLPDSAFLILLHFILAIVGFLFILDFPLKKPSLKEILAFIGVMAFTVAIIFIYTKFRVPRYLDETSMITDKTIEEIYEGDAYEAENP